MTRTAGALIGRRRSSAFWGLGCPKTHHEIKDSLVSFSPKERAPVCHAPMGPLRCSEKPADLKLAALKQSGPLIGFFCASHSCQNGIPRGALF
ncbi:MAG: hypothetical protein ABW170_09435 [Candidatus Thiodiazotropha sp. L084R]